MLSISFLTFVLVRLHSKPNFMRVWLLNGPNFEVVLVIFERFQDIFQVAHLLECCILSSPRPGYLLLVSCLLSQEFLCPEPITETMPGPGREIFAAKWRGAFLVML